MRAQSSVWIWQDNSLLLALIAKGVLHEHLLHLLHLLGILRRHHSTWRHHKLLLRHGVGINITVVEVLHSAHHHHLLLESHSHLLLHIIVNRNFLSGLGLIHHGHHLLLLLVLNEIGNLGESKLVHVLQLFYGSPVSKHFAVIGDWQFGRHLFPCVFLHQCFELTNSDNQNYLPSCQVVQLLCSNERFVGFEHRLCVLSAGYRTWGICL